MHHEKETIFFKITKKIHLLQTVCTALLEKFTWHTTSNSPLPYKWLPVTRPKDSVKVTFQQKVKGQEEAQTTVPVTNQEDGLEN